MFSLFKKNKKPSESTQDNRINLNHCFPKNWESFDKLKLYTKTNVTLIDLLIFAPEYGILSGEKIGWKYNELKKATIERATPVQKKKSSTQLSIKDSAIRNKLQEVLSFDSTPIAHFFWLPYLSAKEFDSLHASFHDLLPKTQVIFSDDTCANIQEKLSGLLPLLKIPLDHNKIVGALEAHHQILPHDGYPFGQRLPYRERLFLRSCGDHLCTIAGPCRSGRTSLLVRKALEHKLEHTEATLYFISPNQLNNELIRQDFLSLLDFAVIELKDISLTFLAPTDLEKGLERFSVSSSKKDLLLVDDFHLLEPNVQNRLLACSPMIRTLCTVDRTEPEYFVLEDLNYTQQAINTLPAADSWNGVLASIHTVLNNDKRACLPENYLIISNDLNQLTQIQLSLKESKEIPSQIVDEFFSLQYKNTDTLLLTTPSHVSGINKKRVIIIGIDQTEYESYPHLLSRGTDKAIIIPYHNPIQEIPTDEDYQERSGMESDIIA